MSIIQSKRKVISLIVAAMFLVVSIGLNTVSASALSYFAPFEDINDAIANNTSTDVTINTQIDPILDQYYTDSGKQLLSFANITEKIFLIIHKSITKNFVHISIS